MQKTLVVMAAGMGSRFGGLKQIEPVGPNGEFIIDYSAYDAKRAGYDKIVFVIKKEIVRDGYDVILLKAFFEVDDMRLPLAPKTILKQVADDKLLFQLNDQIDGFPEWKACQLNKLPA